MEEHLKNFFSTTEWNKNINSLGKKEMQSLTVLNHRNLSLNNVNFIASYIISITSNHNI